MPQGITRVGQTVWTRLMESQIWHPPAGSVAGALIKETMVSSSTSIWEKATPALSLMLDNSVPPWMSLRPFNLLPGPWSSEGVNPSKSVRGLFERNCQGVRQFLSSTASIPAGFYSPKFWRLFFLALNPWAGGPSMRLGPLTPDISFLIFIHNTWVWYQPVQHLCPSSQSRWGFFLNSSVIGLPFSSVSDSS